MRTVEIACTEPIGSREAVITAEIRPCRETDLPALEWLGLYAPHRELIRQTFEAQQRGEALMLLAVSVGFPIAQIWIDMTGKNSCRSAEFWAIRTFWPLQRRGIGRQMLRTAEKLVADLGFFRAELEVERTNHHALRFYRRLGWAIQKNHPVSGANLQLAKELRRSVSDAAQ